MSNIFTLKKPIDDFFKEYGELVTYPAGQLLIHQKDSPSYIYLVREGFIRINHTLVDGTVRTIVYSMPGLLFTQPGIFYGFDDGRLGFSAETPVTLSRMRISAFLEQIDQDHEFAKAYIDMLSFTQIAYLNRIAAQSAKGVDAQLIHWLKVMSIYYGERKDDVCVITVPITRQAIADMVFATRESVNAAVTKLIKKKLVKIHKKRITILSMKKLEKILSKM